MKKMQTPETQWDFENLRPEYRFDFRKSRPNRYAEREKENRVTT